MNKLKLYKNFLPKKIYEKRNQKIIEKEKTAIIIILIINTIFSFESISKLIELNSKKTTISTNVEYKEDKKILLNKFIDIFNNIEVEGEIINGKGSIKIDEENVKDIEGMLKINSIELQEKWAYLKLEGE